MWKLKATGCIMGKCQNCSVEILDAAERCPLCHSVLDATDELENMYPDVRIKMRRLLLSSRIYLFCAILAEAVLIGINLLTDSQIWWSAITGLALLCGYTILRYAILGKAGYRAKILILALIGVSVAVATDVIIGYRGWSVDYVLPAGILLVDVIIAVYMICNHRNWQSYIMWQILMILCSFLPAILYLVELEHNQFMAFLPLAVSAALFLGTMIIGDRRARLELKRRFHVN